jgi:hypothetical protein
VEVTNQALEEKEATLVESERPKDIKKKENPYACINILETFFAKGIQLVVETKESTIDQSETKGTTTGE